MFSEADDPNPFKKLQESFFRLGPLVGKTLVNLAPSFDHRSYAYIASQRPLELLSDPEKMLHPTIQQHYIELMYSQKLQTWIVYGYLMCPEGLGG